MPYHITRPAKLDSSITLYYHGGNRWCDESVGRVTFATLEEANAKVSNTDGKNGGFANATVVSE
jgi:hypothetical protein